MKESYESPLSSRYASKEMLTLFSQRQRIILWRRLWTELAREEMRLGLPVSPEQVSALEDNIENIDWDSAASWEKKLKHDVMAHIKAYGEAAPAAAPILHLGATSCYVTDNADLILYRDGMLLIRQKLLNLMALLASFADKYKALATPGYTHYQFAQTVTVGKRACLWLQDFEMDLEELDQLLASLPFLGCRGTTGTEASFAELFDGQVEKADKMNAALAKTFGFARCVSVCGQTYPRKLDSRILNKLSLLAQSAYRMAQDIRLLQHDGQLEEPFGESQVGSSAMAYKRNPMKCERICSLSRYLMVDALNGTLTASAQWLERTLDDSANRRISLPEAFLAADSILLLCANVIGGLKVNEKVIAATLQQELPFLATENILMEAVKHGGDRQAIHELIRRCSMEARARMNEGLSCDLLERLLASGELPLREEELRSLCDPSAFTGRCAEQVESYLARLRPLLQGVNAHADDTEV